MTDILNIDMSALFKQITGRDPTEEDMAILEHVFIAERPSDRRVKSIDLPVPIHRRQYNLLLDAMNLNLSEDDPILKLILSNPGVYRLLLYYHLMTLNNLLVEEGWLPTYQPLYSSEKIGYRGDNRLLDRSQYTDLMRRTNRRFEEILLSEIQFNEELFPLRMIYASVIESELKKYPFSLNIHSTIREMCHHEVLEYVMNVPHRVVRDLSETGPIPIPGKWSQYQIQFYKDLYDVPTPELFLEAMRFASTGAYGSTFSSLLGDKISLFMKYNESMYDTIHEYRIGRELNRFYDQCPFIMYTYGLTNLRIVDYSLINYQAVLDNQSQYSIDQEDYKPVLMAQWLPDSMSLRQFINSEIKSFELDDQGNIVEVDRLESLERILMAIMCTLRFLWKQIGFVHGDLHFDNIQIVRFDRPQILPLPDYPGRVFNLSAVPILIDYGFSTILRPLSNEVDLTRAIIPEGSRIVLNPTDAALVTQEAYVSDLIKILVHMYEYSSQVQDQDFYELIASTYYRAFTGQSIDVLSSDIKRILNILIHRKIGSFSEELDELKNRMIPIGLRTYDPDGAIEEFVEKVYRDSNISPSMNPTEYRTIDDKISGLIREEGLTISTYSGAIVYNLYPDQVEYIDPTYTENVLQSFKDLQQLLDDAYAKSLLRVVQHEERLKKIADLFFSAVERTEDVRDPSEDVRLLIDISSIINLQYVYRYQINNMIESIIPQ